MSRPITRLWPLALAVLGVVLLSYSAFNWVAQQDVGEVGEEPSAPPRDALVDEHFEEVRAHEIDVFSEFKGRVKGEGTIDVRAPQGMVVPVVKIHKEHGEFVEKGELLLTFAKEKIEKAIEQARAEGDEAKVARFESYLEHAEMRAPADGQVLEIYAEQGAVPYDQGIPLMVLADQSSYSFIVLVPESVATTSAHIGARLEIELEAGIGTAAGAVNTHGKTSEGELATVGGYVQLVIGLDPMEGLEQGLAGTLRVPTSKQEIGLVPQAAVEWRGETPFVRAWEEGEVLERSIKIDGEEGTDYRVLYGISPGEFVVVPGPAPGE